VAVEAKQYLKRNLAGKMAEQRKADLFANVCGSSIVCSNGSCCVLLPSFRASSNPMFSIPGLFPIPETTLALLKKTQRLYRKSLTRCPSRRKYGWHMGGIILDRGSSSHPPVSLSNTSIPTFLGVHAAYITYKSSNDVFATVVIFNEVSLSLNHFFGPAALITISYV
jgi:hypothetical protein